MTHAKQSVQYDVMSSLAAAGIEPARRFRIGTAEARDMTRSRRNKELNTKNLHVYEGQLNTEAM
jgi:hypothetical protein